MNKNLSGASNAHEITIPAIVFLIITPMFVGLRFWSRRRALVRIGLDDWTILSSLVFSVSVSALMIASTRYGFGKHVSSLSASNKKIALKLFYAAQVLYKMNINMTKASILLLYLRIFIQKFFKIICWIMIVIVTCYGIASAASAVFQCIPINRAWDKTIPGNCIDITKNWYANAGFSIATDFIILLLPMPIIYSLQLRTGQKILVMLVFALGSFVVFTSIMRMTTLDLSSTSADTTFDISSSMWTIIEANIGIICACLPMCREPISIFFPTLLSSRTRIDADFSHAGSGKNDWSPPTHKSQGLRMASINISSIDNNSEEHILRDDKVEERDLDNEIRNITRFQVDYDVDDAYNDRSCYREEVRASGTLNGFQRHFIKLTSSA